MRKTQKLAYHPYGLLMGAVAVAGVAPAFLNFAVDPYEMFNGTNQSKYFSELAEKSHYPLWKFSHYKGDANLVVLGDSRARALRDKYWHELGETGAYNFAYGGGTIPEIYATFQQIRNNANLKTLVVGIQLRSFDENHKGGMNRVPEAIKATATKVNYLKNWFVVRKSWDFIKEQNAQIFEALSRAVPSPISSANAVELGPPGTTGRYRLLEPEICYGCDLPDGKMVNSHYRTKGPNLGLGRGDNYLGHWTASIELPERALPAKFARQVEKNARSDWKVFRFSERYLAMMQEMAKWADAHEDRSLIFVIPPTIVEMQNTISAYGMSALDESLRRKLSSLAPVLDFDFPNEKTRAVGNFTDAYHFNSKFARQIVAEILMTQGATGEQRDRIDKRRKGVECPTQSDVERLIDVVSEIRIDGQACRIWLGGNNG